MAGIWGETNGEKLQRLHNEGGNDVKTGEVDTWHNVILRECSLDEEEKAAYQSGVDNARKQKD